MRIELTKNRNLIFIAEPYFEMVRFRNLHSLFAEFDIEITPRNDNIFQIETDDETAKDFINYSINGLTKYFNKLRDNEIMINGLTAHISNNKFHAVDSKPICYQLAIIESLNNLIESSKSRRLVTKSSLKGRNYTITKYNEKLSFSNADFESCYLAKNPLNHYKSILLSGNYSLAIANVKLKITIVSQAQYYSSSTKRSVGVSFKKNKFLAAFQIRVYEILLKVRADFDNEGVNLFGFVIYFELLEEDVNWNKELWDQDFLLHFEWALRNLLTNKESIETKNEIDRD